MSSEGMTQGRSVKETMDTIDVNLTRVFLPVALRHPRYLLAYRRLRKGYERAAHARREAAARGVKVPPFLIISITDRCNLRCAGCYAAATGAVPDGRDGGRACPGGRLGLDQWRDIIGKACEAGVYGLILAGGEPFLYPGLLDLCEEFNDRFFLIFTNGTLITEEHYRRLRKASNIAVVVSMEGGRDVTDARRGRGVHRRAMAAIRRLASIGTVTGVSVTINRSNYRYWMNSERIDELISVGVRLAVLLEYIPTTAPGDTEAMPACNPLLDLVDQTRWTDEEYAALTLTKAERAELRARILELRERKAIYLIHSPGDEEFFGGCVSAGRGFAHVTPAGDLTPCPISDVATHNLTSSSFEEALSSPLFTEIRANEHLLETEDAPCALFAHPEEVERLARSVGAYHTGGGREKQR